MSIQFMAKRRKELKIERWRWIQILSGQLFLVYELSEYVKEVMVGSWCFVCTYYYYSGDHVKDVKDVNDDVKDDDNDVMLLLFSMMLVYYISSVRQRL